MDVKMIQRDINNKMSIKSLYQKPSKNQRMYSGTVEYDTNERTDTINFSESVGNIRQDSSINVPLVKPYFKPKKIRPVTAGCQGRTSNQTGLKVARPDSFTLKHNFSSTSRIGTTK